MLKHLLLIVSLFSLAACSSVQRSPQEKAITYALVGDATLRQLADECSQVSAGAKQAAWKTYRSWWKRNANLVEAADYGLTNNIVSLTGARLDTGGVYAMGITFDIVALAQQDVAKVMNTGDKEDACIDKLGDYRDGLKDLRENDEYYNMLVTLQHEKDLKGKNLNLKMSQISKKAKKKHSRSAYVVERLVKREGCPLAKVTTLKADWPMEVFEATCPDNSYLLVRCEWGNCQIQD